jgi:hypothetical protein
LIKPPKNNRTDQPSSRLASTQIFRDWSSQQIRQTCPWPSAPRLRSTLFPLRQDYACLQMGGGIHWPHRIKRYLLGIGYMTTATIIMRVAATVVGLAFWGNAIYSLIVGVRHGFRVPRSLHWIAVGLLLCEVLILLMFPLDISTISPLLGVILLCLPISPYAGWVMSGGPARCRDDEERLEGIAHRDRDAPA